MNNDFLPDRDGVWERYKESAKDTYNAQEIGLKSQTGTLCNLSPQG